MNLSTAIEFATAALAEKPLIQGDSPSVMVDGIPRHLYMSAKR